MITNDTAPEGAPTEQIVPSALLAVDGVEPAAGDDVEFTVRGVVNRSEGGKTFVKIMGINGEDLPEVPAASTDESVREAAEDADESSY